jgi:hypothetical protein
MCQVEKGVEVDDGTLCLAPAPKPHDRGSFQIAGRRTRRRTFVTAQLQRQLQVKAQQSISYQRFDTTLAYMHDEMITNSHSETTRMIKSLLDAALHPGIFSGDPGQYIIAATAAWVMKVRSGGPWDHKPKLAQMLGLKQDNDYFFPIRGDTDHEYYYDIWSNIHFGFVGTAAGWSARDLQEGAAFADALVGRNDPVDVITVQIGIDLWNKYGDKMSPSNLHQAILSHQADLLAAQQTAEYKKDNPTFRHVIPMTNYR